VILRSIRGDTSGMVMNISSDGMFIQTETLFMIGEMVDLSFTYRSTQWTLSLKTMVVRTAPGSIGIRIL
jgi:Tfp pilus assembly protein PilZ